MLKVYKIELDKESIRERLKKLGYEVKSLRSLLKKVPTLPIFDDSKGELGVFWNESFTKLVIKGVSYTSKVWFAYKTIGEEKDILLELHNIFTLRNNGWWGINNRYCILTNNRIRDYITENVFKNIINNKIKDLEIEVI